MVDHRAVELVLRGIGQDGSTDQTERVEHLHGRIFPEFEVFEFVQVGHHIEDQTWGERVALDGMKSSSCFKFP